MSGVLNSIRKVFLSPISAVIGGKAGRIIRKVALGAIMVGAVVMTGGAALGILPSLGTMVGGLGLSAGLTSVLTGAISTGAVGAVTGMLSGGFKGATKGFLIGAATGGVLGGLGMMGPNGLIGGGKAAASAAGQSLSTTTAGGVATTGASGAAATGLVQNASLAQGLSTVGPSFSTAGLTAPTLAPLTTAVPALGGASGAAASSGVMGFLNSNPLLASQLLGGVSSAFAPNEYANAAKAKTKAEQEAAYNAFGGGDANGSKKGGMVSGVYSSQGDPFGRGTYGTPPNLGPGNYYQPRSTRWVWDPNSSTVVEVGA